MQGKRLFVGHHPTEHVQQVRTRFYEELTVEPDQFEADDVQCVLSDDYWIERYLSNHSGTIVV